MKLDNNQYYERHKPKPGSQLYLALVEYEKANQALQEINDVISSLKARKAADLEALAALDWNTKLSDVVTVQQRLGAYGPLLQKAEAERARRQELRRRANIEPHRMDNEIQTQKRLITEGKGWLTIHQHEKSYSEQIPHVELDIELASQKLEQLIAAYC